MSIPKHTQGYFRISSYLQALQKVSPLRASLTLLPYTLALFVLAILAGGWVGKYSNQLLIAGGLVVMAMAMVATGIFLGPTAGFLVYLVPLTLLGGGQSTANTPRVHALLGSAPPEMAGSAFATNNAGFQPGGSLGIAVMGALFGSLARNTYYTELTKKGLDQASIQKSIEELNAWLKTIPVMWLRSLASPSSSWKV